MKYGDIIGYTKVMNEQLDRIEVKLIELEGKIDATFKVADKVRKYMLWTGIITVAVIVVPLLIIPFLLPAFFSAEGLNSVGGLGGF